ncbi:leucyl aminopeptidase family protein [Hirschia litorea]|uniref:Leucyl aminopeptidase family protein n=1 Tax=Hirschia litorea TaxID=1199156 RepID=A0ABW2IJM9_9PROT
MTSVFTSSAKYVVRLHVLTTQSYASWLEGQEARFSTLAQGMGFKAQTGKSLVVPNADGQIEDVLFGIGGDADTGALAAASASLPEGAYALTTVPEGLDVTNMYAAWADGAYRFTQYKDDKSSPPQLVITDKKSLEAAQIEEASIKLVRDMINTPAEDMGPTQIGETVEALAKEFGAEVKQIIGDDLLKENYPMVHAVGRAAADAPRYVELSWGDKNAPHIALVGKGVAFDTGGLNIKTGGYMRHMKKDMGGAAHVIGLARMIMASKLNVYLTLHVPTVENAIGAGAFRPGDILKSRKGLSVEIDNTDAEGRLVLGDALTRASELKPELLLDFATLTGAARVAMGAEVAPFFATDEAFAASIYQSGVDKADPIWRLPLWKPYLAMMKSPVADLVNGASSPFAGTITAALFLQEFVDAKSWAHFDVWGWRNAQYGRPEGGAAFGLRAVMSYLTQKYS